MTTAETGPLVLNVLTLEELVMVCADLHLLEGWLLGPYCTSTAAVVGTRHSSSTVAVAGSSGPFAAAGVDLKAADAVRAVLASQVRHSILLLLLLYVMLLSLAVCVPCPFASSFLLKYVLPTSAVDLCSLFTLFYSAAHNLCVCTP